MGPFYAMPRPKDNAVVSIGWRTNNGRFGAPIRRGDVYIGADRKLRTGPTLVIAGMRTTI